LQLAAVAAIATLAATSAFADNRPSRETQHRESRSIDRRDRARSAETFRNQQPRNNNESYRDSNRNRGNDNNRRETSSWNRDNNRNRDNNNRNRDNRSYRDNNWNRNNNSYRDNNRGYRDNGYRNNDRYRGRTPYYAHGRVSRYERYGGGYRVWIGGVNFPFFIPEARFRLFPRFHVGLDIRLGGYYNDGGYYDYYDDGGYYDRGYASNGLRGVVEAVDLRRGTIFVRADGDGAFVRVVMRGYDRLLDDVRIGDVVDLSGDWTRTGLFEAYRIENLDPRGSFYR